MVRYWLNGPLMFGIPLTVSIPLSTLKEPTPEQSLYLFLPIGTDVSLPVPIGYLGSTVCSVGTVLCEIWLPGLDSFGANDTK